MAKLRIVLVNAGPLEKVTAFTPPLGLLYLAACARWGICDPRSAA